MSAFIHTETLEYPLYEGDVRLCFPNTAFPEAFEAPAPYAPVASTPRPVSDPAKVVTEATPQNIDGVWTQVWQVEDASQEVLDARREDAWTYARSERTALLAKCDWTQLADSPLNDTDKAAWATYRQALRDITTQPDPFSIVWPVAP